MNQIFDKFLVNDWRHALKFASLWIYLLVGLSPQIFELAVQFDLIATADIPALFQKIVNWGAFLGAVCRMIDQAAVMKGLTSIKAPDEPDNAGA